MKIMQATSHSERFEAAFNRLHKNLLNIVKNTHTDRFSSLVNMGAKKHHLIRHYQEDLYQFAKLRNALVHEKIDIGYYIAEPHEKVVNQIEMIGEHFDKPKSVMTIATKPVVCFDHSLLLKDALKAIREFNYTQYPVYKDGDYSWLITSNGVMKWMAEHLLNDTIHIQQTLVSEVLPLEIHHSVEFLSRQASIFDVEYLFETYHGRNKKLEAVVITERGRPSEKPLGIITSWDLIEVDMLD